MSVAPAIAELEPAVVGTRETSGRPLTRVGLKRERLGHLVSLGFLTHSQQPEKSWVGPDLKITTKAIRYFYFRVQNC